MHIEDELKHKLLRQLGVVAILAMLLMGLTTSFSFAADPANGVDIDALIDQMTLDQKLALLTGIGFFGLPERCLGSAGYVAGVPELGVPGLCMSDGPAGVRVNLPATAMPAPVALASTFDTSRARSYGQVIGREGRAYGQDVLLSPMVNIVRVPMAGRNFETLGEDPFLASRIVGQEVSGIQSEGLIATIKHYVANNQENNRQQVNVNVSEQTLHEIYLSGFEGAVNGGTGAVMCAYNRVNGAFSCENEYVLTTVLREQWGFNGWVLTDWGANHPSGVDALVAGLDQEMPGGFGAQWFTAFPEGPLKTAVLNGDISETYVDQAVRRILVQMDRVGLLDGSAPPRPDIDDIKDTDAAVAKDIARAGAVLLRNERRALPLKKSDLRSLVVIGPTAVTPLIGGGGSARVIPFYWKSPLEALIEQAGPKADITYVKGIDLDGAVVPGEVLQTPTGEPGLLRTASDGTTQIDLQVDYTGSNALPAGSSWTWTGTLVAPTTGDYELKLQTAATSGVLRLDGQQIASTGGFFSSASLIPTVDGLDNASATVYLEAGAAHEIAFNVGPGFFGPPSTQPLQVRLAWVTPEQREANVAEAVEAARSARAAVVFAYVEGTEGVDRPDLSLPGNQNELIEAVAEAKGHRSNTIVVLNVGAPVAMPWVEKVNAILNTWYPGQEGADATAELLLGKANPSGKLPETFPVRLEDNPTYPEDGLRYPGIDNEQYYNEGIFMGYRWYDEMGIEPLFPFGHGLSYTRFDYSKLKIRPSGDGYDVSFRVRNVGGMPGAEVPQVYLGPPSDAPVPMAPKQLVGFERIELKRGHGQDVTVHIGARELSYWSDSDDAWVVAEGSRPIYVGSSSRDIRLEGSTDGHKPNK